MANKHVRSLLLIHTCLDSVFYLITILRVVGVDSFDLLIM